MFFLVLMCKKKRLNKEIGVSTFFLEDMNKIHEIESTVKKLNAFSFLKFNKKK